MKQSLLWSKNLALFCSVAITIGQTGNDVKSFATPHSRLFNEYWNYSASMRVSVPSRRPFQIFPNGSAIEQAPRQSFLRTSTVPVSARYGRAQHKRHHGAQIDRIVAGEKSSQVSLKRLSEALDQDM